MKTLRKHVLAIFALAVAVGLFLSFLLFGILNFVTGRTDIYHFLMLLVTTLTFGVGNLSFWAYEQYGKLQKAFLDYGLEKAREHTAFHQRRIEINGEDSPCFDC
jgi:hypothetical protein